MIPLSGIKMTKKLLSTYRKTKSEIPLLEHEIAYMQQEDNGFDNSIILDYRAGCGWFRLGTVWQAAAGP